ncbi:ankyrin repeat domain-containing protein [Candidatus Micrarchaeota archaeon]|nr:ankyrin repeat domain-containing protein [Candidatus Micrarchaeota archaeon]
MDLNEELLRAAKEGDAEAVERLIQEGADINTRDDWGETALTHAIENGHTETAKFLIEKGADVNVKDWEGRTALIRAAEKGYTETARFLIEKGADINTKDILGKTALILAAEKGHTETAEFLIEKGADINTKDILGKTALMLAVSKGHTETVEFLIQKGADVVSAYKKYNARETINQLAREKPELFTKEQRFIFEMYSNPKKFPQDKKKEVIKVLRESQKKGIISKIESLKLFTNLQEIWNENTNIKSKEMRKPLNKPDGNNLKRINRVM